MSLPLLKSQREKENIVGDVANEKGPKGAFSRGSLSATKTYSDIN